MAGIVHLCFLFNDLSSSFRSGKCCNNFALLVKVYWTGISGLQGPSISGTNVFINRKALYGLNIDDGEFLVCKYL